jgi:MoxR-like ATPase
VQSALLEAMQENKLLLAILRLNRQAILVLATQNPIEQEGTSYQKHK